MPSESKQISDTEALCQDMKNTIHLAWCWQLKCFACRLYHSNASAISIGLIILGESIVIRLIVQTYEKNTNSTCQPAISFARPQCYPSPAVLCMVLLHHVQEWSVRNSRVGKVNTKQNVRIWQRIFRDMLWGMVGR